MRIARRFQMARIRHLSHSTVALPVGYRLIEGVCNDVLRDGTHCSWVVVDARNILRGRKVAVALESLLEILFGVFGVREFDAHLHRETVHTRLILTVLLLNCRWRIVKCNYLTFKL